jgi:hypothetical protein
MQSASLFILLTFLCTLSAAQGVEDAWTKVSLVRVSGFSFLFSWLFVPSCFLTYLLAFLLHQSRAEQVTKSIANENAQGWPNITLQRDLYAGWFLSRCCPFSFSNFKR